MSPPRKRTKPKRARSSGLKLAIDDAIQLAIGLQQKGDVPAAAKIYRSILNQHPNDVNALHFLGIAEHQLGHSLEALRLIDLSSASEASMPSLWSTFGRCWNASQNITKHI